MEKAMHNKLFFYTGRVLITLTYVQSKTWVKYFSALDCFQNLEENMKLLANLIQIFVPNP